MSDRDRACAQLLRAVGHPTRVWMVLTLRASDEPLSASGWHGRRKEADVGLGTVAYHARELFGAGLLVEVSTRRRRGAIERFYRLSAPGAAVADLVAELRASNAIRSLR